ncbi:ester hydrolase C11orf54 homolog [Orbicella faveolata]|uniref:ester hydrolase C11orf54 homolog n=1 Tax=Orbicella faveolata TaxID=48498 RepID=UPI0009E54028|nr:ester hydrolase C11orf54 homolog [Orbicella faveolata]
MANTGTENTSTKSDYLPIESRHLLLPPLEELVQVLKAGLAKNFSNVEVEVVDCPDLREKPWKLAAPGICGRTRIADVGGPPYLIPLPNLSKLYIKCCCIVHQVLKVCASKRTGDENFITCMRHTLAGHYGNRPVGVGGVFVIEKGKAKIHIMPKFSETPLKTDTDVNNWLKFYNMSAPLVCVGVFESHDPGLDLRIEHFHCFSDHGEGGHYHYDVTPVDVQYTGFFSLAEKVYRIDRPQTTHNVGRD